MIRLSQEQRANVPQIVRESSNYVLCEQSRMKPCCERRLRCVARSCETSTPPQSAEIILAKI